MVERESILGNLKENIKVFDNPPEGSPLAVINFLNLAEREGAYKTLTEKTRRRLEMRFLEGLSISEIAGVQGVSKQAVSQAIKRFPKMLYKQMEKDVSFGKTRISYREILLSYSNCMLYFQEQKKTKSK